MTPGLPFCRCAIPPTHYVDTNLRGSITPLEDKNPELLQGFTPILFSWHMAENVEHPSLAWRCFGIDQRQFRTTVSVSFPSQVLCPQETEWCGDIVSNIRRRSIGSEVSESIRNCIAAGDHIISVPLSDQRYLARYIKDNLSFQHAPPLQKWVKLNDISYFWKLQFPWRRVGIERANKMHQQNWENKTLLKWAS